MLYDARVGATRHALLVGMTNVRGYFSLLCAFLYFTFIVPCVTKVLDVQFNSNYNSQQDLNVFPFAFTQMICIF